MKLHRFYIDQELLADTWIKDSALLHQWKNVLRFQVGREVVLFNSLREVKMYRIEEYGGEAVHVSLVTEMQPQVPENDTYLCFSLLKKDKVDWVLQKATELGVSHFVPLICNRTEKTGWNEERAIKIVTEAAEQSGRADIPRLREPITPQKLIEEFEGNVAVYVAEQGDSTGIEHGNIGNPRAVFIGPEGGWSDDEKAFYKSVEAKHISLSKFTLRAETAAITAAALLQ